MPKLAPTLLSPLLLLSACVSGALEGKLPVEARETSPLALAFEKSGAEFEVPPDLLKAWAYVETKVVHVRGEVELEGQPAPYGVFALRGEELALGSALAGFPESMAAEDLETGIRAGAALLSAYATEAGLGDEDRSDPLAWGPALQRYGEIDDELRSGYLEDVLGVVRTGLIIPLADGTNLIVRRYESGQIQRALERDSIASLPSPNNSSRGSHQPVIIVLHSCEGAYAGCVSWLRNSSAQVSAHYVVAEDGRIAQLVSEARKAWHVRANYRSRLNGGALPHLDGVATNAISIGIEHAGFARQTLWPEAQLARSIELLQDITERNNIPRSELRIVAHGRLQPENRTDPGSGWPWARVLADLGAQIDSDPESTTSPGTAPITIDNGDSTRFRASSAWISSTWAAGRVGDDYRARRPRSVSDPAEFRVPIETPGTYEVFVRAPGNGYNARTPVRIVHRNGESIGYADLSRSGGSWVSVGRFPFNRVDDWNVAISCWTTGTDFVVADAVRLEPR